MKSAVYDCLIFFVHIFGYAIDFFLPTAEASVQKFITLLISAR